MLLTRLTYHSSPSLPARFGRFWSRPVDCAEHLWGSIGFTRKHPEVVAQTVQLMTEAMGASEVHDPELEVLNEADAFWKYLVETVGKPRAKQIMQFVMGEKKTGRSGDLMLPLISNYIHVWGLEEVG